MAKNRQYEKNHFWFLNMHQIIQSNNKINYIQDLLMWITLFYILHDCFLTVWYWINFYPNINKSWSVSVFTVIAWELYVKHIYISKKRRKNINQIIFVGNCQFVFCLLLTVMAGGKHDIMYISQIKSFCSMSKSVLWNV